MATRPVPPPEDRKPLVLLEPQTSAEIARTRVPKLEPALAGVVQAEPDPERCFRRLLAAGEKREAERFLAAALRRRVQVWWGYVCVRAVLAGARAQRAALAAGGGGQAGAMAAVAALPPVVPGAPPVPVLGVSPDLGITAEQFQPPPPVVGGVDLSDPAAWPKPTIKPDGTIDFLPAALAPLRQDPLRRPDAADRFFAYRQAFIDALPAEERGAFLAKDAGSGAEVRRMLGAPMADIINADREAAMRSSGVGSYADPQAPHNRIKAALAAKKAELQTAMAGWMGQLQAGLATLPKARPVQLAGDTPVAAGALEAVRAWVLNPIAENGRAAMAAGERCEGMEQAAGFLAMACHFSGSDINPAGSADDAHPVPPPPAVAPNLVFTALELARSIPDSGRTPDEWLDEFLALGTQVAQGLLTWDSALHERPATRTPWAGKSGFGRVHAQPEPPQPAG
ncbi:MAG: hypothetical protein L6R48_09915 [Planctomycetes bacterium]|nr:hypothetical protein [Planctomycetota bacterium]